MEKVEPTRFETLEGVVSAVFDASDDAESALEELKRMGFRHDDLGVAVSDPEHFHLLDNSDKETWASLGAGLIAGIPIGTLAGMALTALVIPGLGILGVGGALLVGGTGGALWGAYLGSVSGLATEITEIEHAEHHYDIPLKPNEVLVVVMAHNQEERVRDLVRKHNGRLLSRKPLAAGTD